MDYDFDYLWQFMSEPLYNHVPKFAYAHFDQAHDLEVSCSAWMAVRSRPKAF